jgi:hypothetical protein
MSIPRSRLGQRGPSRRLSGIRYPSGRTCRALVVADREEHEVQLEWLYPATEFPFQVAHGMNGADTDQLTGSQ